MTQILAALLLLISISGYCQELKFHKSYKIACHNCYERQYAANIEDVLNYTTAIEIDIWDNEIASGLLGSIFGDKMDRDWFVKHDPRHRGNDNCCGGTFRNCLERIKTWSNEHPGHDVLTIFIDKKENWSDRDEARKPGDLDQLILSVFQKDKIYTPSALMQFDPNLRTAALNGNWPTLDSLKGKFIFALTKGTALTSRNPLNEYLSSQQGNAICFICPEIASEDEIVNPPGFSPENLSNIVFYNLKYGSAELAPKINERNCISRIYGAPLPETKEVFDKLINFNINFVAMFNFKL